MRIRVVLQAGAIVLAASMPAMADGDAAAGLKVFNKCKACHDAVGDKNKVGPNLSGVHGRTAGTLESYGSKYSKAMKEAGAAGLVWDDANLTEYLRAPRAKVPGGKMAFAGLKKDEDLANIIAYLKADPKPE
ncbi:c-type cytochrome [Aquibium oceanicum]|uniref:Cytochrome C n=1 Tax=Aquibium oceanicum TaxID=1670800 RepID=A0A1L3SQ13_9HYPH|nr:cytochrome C [Aquibium oceanicum]